ncbi:MAG: glutamine-hydrolyzing GMP synthase [Chloroflexi bacterium]|nr:glutamine-hydrolyzing GMP synthase [Chloroflexota bacterium]MCY3938467.1 glutamine-hydrolyzing GMP synthase [Chloroflexota bacterium]
MSPPTAVSPVTRKSKVGLDTIVVLDYGSQYTPLIARRIRESEVYSEILPFDAPAERVRSLDPKGIILSGSDASVYETGAPDLPDYVLELGIPVLGICYGMQLVSRSLGGSVRPGTTREYGPATLEIVDRGNPLFKDFPERSRVWMSHGDQVTAPPFGFEQLARTDNSEWAAIGNADEDVLLLQFHPEVRHTQLGHALIRNFATGVCGSRPEWTPASFVEGSIESLRREIGGAQVILALSGGVDSTVAAALLHRAVGDQLTCIFVDTGLLREGEVEEVEEAVANQLHSRVITVDARARFLKRLAGVTDPELKREIIGDEFFNVFIDEAEKLEDVEFFVQGTLYPDVIESGTAGLGSAKIKTHHNTRIPDELSLQVIEPLKRLFKDEVRQVGIELGLPESIVWRQPFPGPGLAVRIMGEITSDRLAALRRADLIFRDEVAREGLDLAIGQYFAVLTGVRTVGVMGDGRTYGEMAALRAVSTDDYMTADWYRLPNEVLERSSARIVNEVPAITRVVYDITSKPPGTIEWE